ncbi:HIT domain-containing protein [Candidatus Woesearchaeota archaeon]|nr:HIT domain-containing protein [Candidatus Woesearchaeota archaeon]
MEEPDISKLSPSEIEELQRKNCVFCHIASGKVPARKVYEDDSCLAVLDINPASPGHMLLMPKEHFTVMLQVPEQLIGHVFVVAKGLSQASLQALQGKGTTIFAANGTAAGQRAPHFMLHIIPRSPGDNIGMYIPSRALPEKEAAQVAAALSAVLGGKVATAAAVTTGQKSSSGSSKEEPKEKKETVVEANVVREEKAARGNSTKEESTKEEAHAEEADDLDALTEFLAGSGTGGKGSGEGGGGK